MAVRATVTIDIPELADPFSSNTTRSPRAKLRAFRSLLKRIASGGLASRGAGTRPTVRISTGDASGTVTFATTSVTGNAVVINGVSFSGTQLAARATATLVTPVATNSVTIQSVAFTALQLNARATATLTSAVAGNTITIGGQVFTGTTGAVSLGDPTFSVDTGDTAAAVSLAAQINAHAVTSPLVSASSALGVVKIRALLAGTAGNAIAIAKVGSPIALTATGGGALAGAFLEGGLAQTVAGWDYGDSDTQGAVALAAVVNASPDAAIAHIITATSALGVVTLKSVLEGVVGNAYTLTKSGSPITVTGSGFLASGAAYSGNQYDGIYKGGTVAQVAASLAAAVNRSTTALVLGVVRATSAAGVTTITATEEGLAGNAITLTASGTGPTASAAVLSGGTSTLLTF